MDKKTDIKKQNWDLRVFGPTGMKFTAVGLGTWNMERDPRKSIEALRRGIDEGANHVDTAEMYGDGSVETIVGEALQGLRDRVKLVSKVLPSHSHYADVLEACERSLKRLKTDHLDVYLLHWKDRSTPLEKTFGAFEKLRSQGKILHWGVSNFGVKDMENALRVAGKDKIACNQVLYNLNERSIEFELIPWCRAHNIPVVAYSPLGQGRLPDGRALETIAKSHKATTAQVALAYLIRDPQVFAIPKSSHSERTAENIQSMRLKLSEEDVRAIDKAFPARPRTSLPMV